MLLHWCRCDKCGEMVKDDSFVTYEKITTFRNRENFDLCKKCNDEFTTKIIKKPEWGHCWHCGKEFTDDNDSVYDIKGNAFNRNKKHFRFELCPECREKLILPLINGYKR